MQLFILYMLVHIWNIACSCLTSVHTFLWLVFIFCCSAVLNWIYGVSLIWLLLVFVHNISLCSCSEPVMHINCCVRYNNTVMLNSVCWRVFSDGLSAMQSLCKRDYICVKAVCSYVCHTDCDLFLTLLFLLLFLLKLLLSINQDCWLEPTTWPILLPLTCLVLSTIFIFQSTCLWVLQILL